MAKLIAPLTDQKIKNAKSAKKQFALFDGGGLHIIVMPTGKKLWRFKYKYNGKGKLMSLGSYPDVSLKVAREKHSDLMKLVKNGSNPVGEIKMSKLIIAGTFSDLDSFETVAREWHRKTKNTLNWKPVYSNLVLRRLEMDVFPALGYIKIFKIEPIDIVKVLEAIENRNAPVLAHRIQGYISKIFCHSVATAKIKINPTADLRGFLPPATKTNYPAVTNPVDIARYLQSVNDPALAKCRFVTKCMLLLCPMLFMRPGELRNLEWSEIDYEEKQIDLPAEKMKMKIAHYVPLSRQALRILDGLKGRSGNSKYVFASKKDSTVPISDHTATMALKRMGFQGELTPHGFRATARTVGREKLKIDTEYLELQLSHKTKSPNGTAYDRVAFLPERHEMMQVWADYLDDLQTGRPAKKHWREYIT